ncbi:MAG: DUF2156 domain-containing protein [Desulfohalobiaceae bacterium]
MPLTFLPLALKRQAEYKRLLAACAEQASDYSFANLWAWREEYGLEWAWQGGLVFLRQTRPETVYWAPVGDWGAADWKDILRELPRGTTFIRVPESLCVLWRSRLGAGVRVREAREHWDYLYSVQELIELKGNRFHNKKNLCNQFRRKYDFDYVRLEKEWIEQALALQTEWCLWRDCQDSSVLVAENRAIVSAFHDWDALEGLTGGGLVIDGDMIAYTVAEVLNSETMVIHFEKACPTIKGAYQAINQMFLEREAASCRLVNREQDMGEQGLRKAKESYNPVGYLKKYQVRLV